MVVHPDTATTAVPLLMRWSITFENLPNNSSNRPGLVHRIDKDTSGLLVIAKTEEAMLHLTQQFFSQDYRTRIYSPRMGQRGS